MSEKKENRGRFAGKAARKNLAELYGASRAESAALRYDRLAELASRDMAASGASQEGELRFYSAPGRTELGGNHTDHNRGRVLCAAVMLDAVACLAPSADTRVRLLSEGYSRPIEVDLANLEPRSEERGTTEALIRGVARGLADRGVAQRGFVGRIHSLVLPGSGLSSSASIEVLLGTAMADMGGAKLSSLDIAKIGQFAENVYFGKPCGLMDQTASAVGGIAAIDFADPAEPLVKRIDYDFEAEGYALVVVNTGGSHADLTADYAAIPAEMRSVAGLLGEPELRDVDAAQIVARGPEIRSSCGDRAFLRALHFVGDNQRVVRMAEALEAGDLDAYLKQVKKSGDSSWRLLQNLYAPENPREQGLPVALALSADFIGKKGAWRVHGGGFAGTIQAYLPRKLLPGYVELMERYFGEGSVIPLVVRKRGAVRVL
jgi:galactokinase